MKFRPLWIIVALGVVALFFVARHYVGKALDEAINPKAPPTHEDRAPPPQIVARNVLTEPVSIVRSLAALSGPEKEAAIERIRSLIEGQDQATADLVEERDRARLVRGYQRAEGLDVAAPVRADLKRARTQLSKWWSIVPPEPGVRPKAGPDSPPMMKVMEPVFLALEMEEQSEEQRRQSLTELAAALTRIDESVARGVESGHRAGVLGAYGTAALNPHIAPMKADVSAMHGRLEEWWSAPAVDQKPR